jgi:hypothetical protein
LASILDGIDVESGGVVDFEIIQKANAPGQVNYQRSSNGMEMDAMRRLIKQWEDD